MNAPTLTPRTFDRDGPLALAEEAYGRTYDAPPSASIFDLLTGGSPADYELRDGVAVVSVEGPLDQRGGFWWDGYDAVLRRAKAALADDRAQALVLALDSPGGVVSGNLDAARALRVAADASGKPFVAHAGTWATSAAYALGIAADKLLVTSDGAVGSVGVIATVYDRTKATADAGLDVRVVRSGALKADPHPDVALTDASVARVRARAMELAQAFAGWVAERRGGTAEAWLAHQGATIYATKALETGFADAIGTLDDAVNAAASMAAARMETKRMEQMNAKAIETVAALRASLGAQSDDELLGAVATLRASAARAEELAASVAQLRADLAARDARDAAAAREAVLARHRATGALTPALEADAAFVADLAPLSPEALDRVLSRLPRLVREPAKPAKAPAASEELTAEERAFAAAAGISPEALLKTKAADAAKKTARAAVED